MIYLDFETYSEAGYQWVDNKPKSLCHGKPGIQGVGAAAYAGHPSTEILSLAYDLNDGAGIRVWIPRMPNPDRNILWATGGTPIETHNSGFEWLIWNLVGVPKYGWVPLPQLYLQCSMAKSLAYGLPAALAKAAGVFSTQEQKDTEGTRLIRKFSIPRAPTKNNPRRRIMPMDDSKDFCNLLSYNRQDVATEITLSVRIPDLIPIEKDIWQVDQIINQRGVYVDRQGVEDCISIVEQTEAKYTQELQTLTGGAVQSVAELQKLTAWLKTRGLAIASLDKANVASILESWRNLPGSCRRALEIRQTLSSSSVKKLYALNRYMMIDNRMRYLFMYHGGHTGRWTGSGPQPHNLPKDGPKDRLAWQHGGPEGALKIIAHRNLSQIEGMYGDSLKTVAGCLRSLLTAAPGGDLICSDFSAIEAVVLAILAGEQWRIDVFNTHGMIYEKSAALISGVPFEEFMAYKQRTGEHHPLRSKLGKYAELASGYGGSIGAWKKFGAGEYLTDIEIKERVDKWRRLSPMIPQFWYTVESEVITAIQYPGRETAYRDIRFVVQEGVLLIKLPSSRNMVYHAPRVDPAIKFGRERLVITYEGVDPKTKQWVRLDTYGGKLTENIVQAVARDILANSMLNLERAGYPIVLHVHDEIAAEVQAGTGSLLEFEEIMSTMPMWARDWPIKAKGGWRGQRYRKE